MVEIIQGTIAEEIIRNYGRKKRTIAEEIIRNYGRNNIGNYIAEEIIRNYGRKKKTKVEQNVLFPPSPPIILEVNCG